MPLPLYNVKIPLNSYIVFHCFTIIMQLCSPLSCLLRLLVID